MKTKTTALPAILFSLALVGAACSDDDGDEHHHHGDGHAHAHDGGHSLNAEGCEHLEQGPFVDVTAGADVKSAAEVKADHQAYRVALTSGQAGFVKFAAAETGDHVLFLDTDVPLEVQDDQGKAVSIESSEKGVAECTTVKAKHTVDLPVGTSFFRLGPASAAQVTVVVEEASH